MDTSNSIKGAAVALSDFPHIGGELTTQQVENLQALVSHVPKWFLWSPRHVNEKGEPKVPINPANGHKGSSSDEGTGGTFDEARAQVGAQGCGRGGGVSVSMLGAAADLVGIDLDHVRDPDTGELCGFATEVMHGFIDGYVEVSPSGHGLRIFAFAQGVKHCKVTTTLVGPDEKPVGVEVYPAGEARHLRCTGALVRGSGGVVLPAQAGVERLVQRAYALKVGGGGGAGASSGPSASSKSKLAEIEEWFEQMSSRRQPADPAEVLAGMQAAASDKPRGKLAHALSGNATKFGDDDSRLDFFLTYEAIRRGCDSVEAVETVLNSTEARRPKWSSRRGEYGDLLTKNVHAALKSLLSAPAKKAKDQAKVSANVLQNVESIRGGGEAIQQDGSGRAKATYLNMVSILRARAAGMFAYDEFRRTVVRTVDMGVFDKVRPKGPGPICNDDYVRVAMFFEREFGMGVSRLDMVRSAVQAVARDARYDPVKARLEQLAREWEAAGKVPMLGRWLVEYAEVDDAGVEDYVRKVGRVALLQAARRVLVEGSEVHTMPVFIGNGGDGKGHMLKALADAVQPGLYQSGAFNLRDAKNVIEALSRFLIVEWAEMSPSKDTAAFKAAMTAQFDTHRKAYDFESEDFDRRFTVWGTTNEREIITDPSDGEARRLWPLYMRYGAKINVEKFQTIAPSLWGEAAWYALHTGERHYIDDRDGAAFQQWAQVTRRCRVSDPHEDALDAYLLEWARDKARGLGTVTSNDVAKAVGLVDPHTGKPKKGDFITLGKLMTARGMSKVTDANHCKAWAMPDGVRRQILERAGAREA